MLIWSLQQSEVLRYSQLPPSPEGLAKCCNDCHEQCNPLPGLCLRYKLVAGFAHRQLPFLKPKGLPLAIGLLSFNYGGHSVFPSLYTSMKNPRQYSRVLDWTFAIVIGLYATMTVLGFAAYGETVK